MDWFQHSTGSHEDPDLSDAWDKFGDAAVTVFWTTLEIYGKEYKNTDSDGNLRLSLGFVSRNMRRKFSKFQKIFEFFQERGRILFQLDGDYIIINIPKFVKIASNWTKRPSPKPTEAPTELPTEAPTAKEKEKEEEKEKKKNIPPTPRKRGITYPEDFEEFWDAYPKKVGKDAALRAWKKRNGDRPATGFLLESIYNQKQSDQWTKDNGQYIPNPATWINQGRWADEVEVREKSKWFNSNS